MLFVLLFTVQIYDPKDIATTRFELAKKTKMSDYIIDCYRELHGLDAAAEIPKGAFFCVPPCSAHMCAVLKPGKH